MSNSRTFRHFRSAQGSDTEKYQKCIAKVGLDMNLYPAVTGKFNENVIGKEWKYVNRKNTRGEREIITYLEPQHDMDIITFSNGSYGFFRNVNGNVAQLLSMLKTDPNLGNIIADNLYFSSDDNNNIVYTMDRFHMIDTLNDPTLIMSLVSQLTVALSEMIRNYGFYTDFFDIGRIGFVDIDTRGVKLQLYNFDNTGFKFVIESKTLANQNNDIKVINDINTIRKNQTILSVYIQVIIMFKENIDEVAQEYRDNLIALLSDNLDFIHFDSRKKIDKHSMIYHISNATDAKEFLNIFNVTKDLNM